MSVYEITFSPTGGTKRVSEILAACFGQESKKVDLLQPDTEYENLVFTPEDLCIVAVPSFGGRVPDAAVSRMRRLQGGHAKAVLTAVYGNRAYEDTLLELKNTLVDAGFVPVAAVAAVAEHSIMRQFAAGRPDAADEQEIKEFGRRICEKLTGDEAFLELKVPGNEPYREYNGLPMKPKAGKKCTGCGKCVKNCPVGAISPEDPSKTDQGKCITCMRCVAVCPSKARGLNKIMAAASAEKMKKVCSGRKPNELYL